MKKPHRAFMILGLLVAAALGGMAVARYLPRLPDDAEAIAPPASVIRTGGPPGPSAEMESGLAVEVTPDQRGIYPRARTQEDPRFRVRSTPWPRPLPSPPHNVPATQVPAAGAPAPRPSPGIGGLHAPAGPSSRGGSQGVQAPGLSGPAASGSEAPPTGEPARPAAPAPPSAEPVPAPAAPPPAATSQPAPVLTPPVPIALEPPRHPDAWRVVVEPPGLAAEIRPESLTARVRLRLRVRDDGAVERVEIAVSSGRPDLDAAAATAARAWRFLPARRDGVPIASAVLIWVAFVVGP